MKTKLNEGACYCGKDYASGWEELESIRSVEN